MKKKKGKKTPRNQIVAKAVKLLCSTQTGLWFSTAALLCSACSEDLSSQTLLRGGRNSCFLQKRFNRGPGLSKSVDYVPGLSI